MLVTASAVTIVVTNLGVAVVLLHGLYGFKDRSAMGEVDHAHAFKVVGGDAAQSTQGHIAVEVAIAVGYSSTVQVRAKLVVLAMGILE